MRRERAQRSFRPQGAKKLTSLVETHFSVDSLKGVPSSHQQPPPKSRKRGNSHLEQLFFVFLAAFSLIYGYYQMLPVFLAAHGERETGAIDPRFLQQRQNMLRRPPTTTATGATTTATATTTDKNPFLPKPGEYAPIRQDTIIPLVQLQQAPTKEYHIFCVSSQPDMASTILTNIAMALFDKPDEHLGIVQWSKMGNQFLTKKENEFANNNVTIVSHAIEPGGDVNRLQKVYRSVYRKVFFLVVDRGQDECMVPQDYTMMCISPKDLLYQQGVDEEKVVIGRLVQRMQQELPYFGSLNFQRGELEAIRRLDFMYDMTLQMRNLPSATSEVKYGIHGGLTD